MRFLSLVLILLCLSGCGYRFAGSAGALPGGVEKLHIPLFVNQTAVPQLEYQTTSRVSEVFSRNNKISQVEKPKRAEAILIGTVSSYSSRALSYDNQDRIGEYRSTMVIDAELRQVGTEEILWQGTVDWSSDYNAAVDKGVQEDYEQEAIDEIVLRLAEELLYRLLDDF